MTTLATILQEPELQPFLPLLYVAWADGDLDDEERALVAEKLSARPHLKPRLREALVAWLDKDRRPSSADLATLHAALVKVLANVSEAGRQSIGAYAEEMARVTTTDPEQARAAVDELSPYLDLGRLPVRAPLEEDDRFARSARFDPATLRAVLDGRLARFRDAARAFLADPEHRAMYGMDKETYRAKVSSWLAELAAAGVGALAYPGVTTDEPDLGGFFATFETLALGDLSLLIKLGVQFGLWGGSIASLGTDEQRRHWLPRVASLEAPGCFAMSEVGHGSNVADLETIARYDAATDELVVHTPSESARKDWVGGAAHDARFATVFAQLEVAGAEHGVHAIVVPIRAADGQTLPGVRTGDCGHKVGLNGVDNGRIWFDQVRVPRAALLSRYARITDDGHYESPIESPSRRFFTMLGTLVGGRLSVAAGAVSAAKVGLAIAIRYATARRQFGAASAPETLLLRYPTHQRRLLPGLAATYAFHFAIDVAREELLALAPGADTRVIEGHIAGMKAGASWHAVQTLQSAREACGGQGYLSVNRLGALRADADIFTTFEGDNTVLLQLLAKSLLTGFREQFARSGMVRFVAGRMRAAVLEKNPFASRGTDEETLRGADLQLAALRFREADLVASAARRIQKRVEAGTKPEEALLEVQEHLVALAHAHVDRRVLEAFVAGVARAEGDERVALDRLRQLHGLCTLERGLGWFLQDGYIEPPRARAIRKLVPRLFEEILPDAVGLVDAFGIPDACLAAPIAFHDPAHPRW